jgi:protease I
MAVHSRKPIAILVADGFEERQLTDTQKKLLELSQASKVIGAEGNLVHGWHEGTWGHHFMADVSLADTLSADFSALLVPDGTQSTAALSRNPHAKRLIKAFVDTGKPTALIGHAVTLLHEAGVAAGRKVAAAAAAREQLAASGATVVDEPVARDGGLMTAQDGRALPSLLRHLMEDDGREAETVGEAA